MSCLNNQYLCPKGQNVCGAGSCYDPSSYSCTNGQIGQKSSSSGGSTKSPSSNTSANCGSGTLACGSKCYDPSAYHCDSGVIAQGPGWQSTLPVAPILSTSTKTLGTGTRKITLINNCRAPVWPGLLAKQSPLPGHGGFGLSPSQRVTLQVADNWEAARIWARTDCRVAGGRVVCLTGQCGSKENGYGVECKGAGGQAPATLAEFTLKGWGGSDYYDISNVDGHNVGISIRPTGGKRVGGTLDA
ncbi:hypothetical protein HK097_002079, partial [Rhizophlyctis rosea]